MAGAQPGADLNGPLRAPYSTRQAMRHLRLSGYAADNRSMLILFHDGKLAADPQHAALALQHLPQGDNMTG
ncbi:MAG TPA: hypothetical protein VM659_14580 [Dongiaceae bacterium]|nr:hypothetical protein [Dongiaceae bacterium]